MAKKKEKLLIFTLSADQALEFWQRVMNKDAQTESERQEILLEMAAEGLVDAISETHRSKDEYIRDISKDFRILDVRSLEDRQGEGNA